MSWFDDLVGFSETDPNRVRANLEITEGGFLKSKVTGCTFRCGYLETPSLAELREQTSKLRGRRSAGEPISVTEIVDDVQELHQDPACNGALFQAASQFNLLEMIGPDVTPEQGVGIYEYDRTQGPACAIACGASTIFRNYFARVDGEQIGQSAEIQIDCLRDFGAALGNYENSLWRMKNGYMLASGEGLRAACEILEAADECALDSLRGALRIGAQIQAGVTLGRSPNIVTQALCSAVPVAYSGHDPALWEPLARLILEAAYEATLHLGVLNQDRTGSALVFMTLVGGGAFGNPTEWITSAIERAIGCHSHSGLDVRIVSYGRSSAEVQELLSRL